MYMMPPLFYDSTLDLKTPDTCHLPHKVPKDCQLNARASQKQSSTLIIFTTSITPVPTRSMISNPHCPIPSLPSPITSTIYHLPNPPSHPPPHPFAGLNLQKSTFRPSLKPPLFPAHNGKFTALPLPPSTAKLKMNTTTCVPPSSAAETM